MSASDSELPARSAYRGWLVVGAVFLSSALNVGPIYAFGLFIDPVQASFGWQRTAISASLSFAAVGSMASPLNTGGPAYSNLPRRGFTDGDNRYRNEEAAVLG